MDIDFSLYSDSFDNLVLSKATPELVGFDLTGYLAPPQTWDSAQ